MPQNYLDRREELQWLYVAAGGMLDIQGAISLGVVFVFRMPKSWSKKRKKEMEGTWCLKRPDLDNALGAVMDAILAEDSNVVRITECAKIWGERDEIRIDIQAEEESYYVPF
jgi:Holliday junction resolvase RusA-like endonuclease